MHWSRQLIPCLLACACSCCLAGSPAGPSASVMTAASKSVAQVIGRNCVDQNRTGSGFVWEASTNVVTALHVIAGCKDVFAYFKGIGEVRATPRRALLKADLALLEIAAQPSIQPLRAAAGVPKVNDTLQVIGYYFGVPSLDSRPLRVTLGSPILGDMVTDNVRSLLRNAGSPSLETEILRLDGNLLPGLSGAPLIDDDGKVSGVGSGGLESGTVGVSWAIKVRYLEELRSASWSASNHSAVSALFSAPLEGRQSQPIPCGAYHLVFLKSRQLLDLLATADDSIGLSQLAGTTGMQKSELDAIEYDLYTEPNSGGSVVLPQGAKLASSGGACVATLADGLYVTVTTVRVNNQVEVQQAALAFEGAFDPAGLWWRLDPHFSYTMPLMRQDGLIVRRKNALGFRAQAMAPAADAFETLMARGTTFVGVRVVNLHFDPLRYQACHLQAATPGCGAVNSFFKAWVAAGLGVQMSTFPPL